MGLVKFGEKVVMRFAAIDYLGTMAALEYMIVGAVLFLLIGIIIETWNL